MIRRISTAIILLTTAALLVFTAKPVNADSSQAHLTDFDSYISEEFSKTHIPGMAITVVDAENILFTKTYGDINSVDTPFVLGSTTKSFTALAIMTLVEDDEVNLGVPISNYLPEVPFGNDVTVMQLLNHTSGIASHQESGEQYRKGTSGVFQYANLNYGLLGEIIEKVSGLSYAEYISQEIFEPLGMAHSAVGYYDGKKNGLTTGHYNIFGIYVPTEVENPHYYGELDMAAGFINSSVSDMGKYLQMYLNNGSPIISESTFNIMFSDETFALSGIDYGMGWIGQKPAGEAYDTFFHGGEVQNFSSMMAFFPEKKTAVIMLFDGHIGGPIPNFAASDFTNNVLSYLRDGNAKRVEPLLYWGVIATVDFMVVVLLALSIVPIIRLQRYSKRLTYINKSRLVVSFALLHVLYPTLLLVGVQLIVPLDLVLAFAPAVFFVVVICIALSYVTGLIKLWLIYKSLSKPTKEPAAKKVRVKK